MVIILLLEISNRNWSAAKLSDPGPLFYKQPTSYTLDPTAYLSHISCYAVKIVKKETFLLCEKKSYCRGFGDALILICVLLLAVLFFFAAFHQLISLSGITVNF